MRYLVSLAGVLAFTGLGAGWLFWIQNSSRTTQLSLDLWFAAWQLSEPVSIPVLVAGSFAAGLALGVLLLGLPSWRNGRRARRLEAELALAGAAGPGAPRDAWRS